MSFSLQRRALLLSYFTVGYNVLEALASLLAGYLAGSIALVGFGLDSLVESLSGGVMIWRFSHGPGLSAEAEERRERQAIKIVGYTFLVLGAYVLYESLKKLYFQEISSPSLLGIIIALVSLIAMPGLFIIKYRTGKSLNSRSLMADSKQTLACAWLSLALLVGLGLNYLFGIWQADPIIGLVVVGFLFKEGWGTLKEGKLCACATCGLPPAAGGDD
ncbi:MAG: cation transporter [Deltaproteobacteria bacterium]|nr:cation transporter [Deltaproteobacteria bacterium]